MNEEPSQPDNLPSTEAPATVGQTPPAAVSRTGMKVIQPLSPSLTVDSPTPPPVPQPVASPSANSVSPSAPNVSAAPPPNLPFNAPAHRPNLSAVYPEPVDNTSLPLDRTPIPPDDSKEINTPHAFNNGYAIGGSIFWYQLLTGIVLGFILHGIDSLVLKTATGSLLISIVSLLYTTVELVILAYIPYSTLKSNDVADPLWVTIVGSLTQLVIITLMFEVAVGLILRTIIYHATPSATVSMGAAGIGIIGMVVYIAFLVACYFLTKVSWGVAFSLFEKITNKVVVKVICIGVIAVIVGGLAYHDLTMHRIITKTITPASTRQRE